MGGGSSIHVKSSGSDDDEDDENDLHVRRFTNSGNLSNSYHLGENNNIITVTTEMVEEQMPKV
jgi:hypothetical protein